MADSVRIKRGVKARLPKSLPLGELAFCTDTRELYVGAGEGLPLKKVIDPDMIQGQLKLNEQLNTKANENDLDVERKRIDSFTKLGEGSTTGDAELTDGRVGADGIIYNNIGSAIRGQINSIKNELNENIIYKCYDGNISDSTNKSDTRWWLNNYLYPIGYVNEIEFNATDFSNCKIMIIDSVTNKIILIKEMEVIKTGINKIKIGIDIKNPFYIGISGIIGFKSTKYSSSKIKFMCYEGDVIENTNFIPTWRPNNEEDTTYIMAIQTKYTGIKELVLNSYINSIYSNKIVSPKLDFDDIVYTKQNSTFISISEGSENSLENAPNNDKWGHYALTNEVFYEYKKFRYIKQIAYTRKSQSCNDGIPRCFIRYLIFNIEENKLDKSSSSLYIWKDINHLEIPENFIKTEMLSDGLIPYEPYDFNKYSNNSANGSFYINDLVYPRGYVKSINLRISGEEYQDYEIAFIKKYDNVIIEKIKGKGHGLIEVNVDKYINAEYYIALKALNSAFVSGKYSVMKYNFLSNKTIASGEVGTVIPLNFPAREDNETVYILAIKVNYASLKEMVFNSNKSNLVTHNKMFVAGDSITAGHPYENTKGIHWWETVGRTLKYDVTVGARNGSGMSYWKGTNACKIAQDTDFTKYNVAIFAFATNDYGNNVEIGSFDDEYTYSTDSSQTFYASIKYVVNTVMTSNPSIMLIFALPINRCTHGTIETKYAYGTANSRGYTLSDYCEAIIKVCDYYGIPYIDRRNSVFNSFSIKTLLVDRLHPTMDGYKILGQEMSARVGALIRPYIEYNGQ